MTPLRVALVHASDQGRGAEQCVMALHRGLRALGHDSTLYVGSRLTDEEGVVEIPYVRGLPGSRRVARALEVQFGWQDIYNPSFRRLADVIKSGTDIVHFHSLWGSAGYADLGALPAVTARWPSLITLHDNWLITGHCASFHACQRWKEGCGKCPDLATHPAINRDGTRFNWERKRRLLARSRLGVVAVSDWLKGIAEASPILAGKQVVRIHNGIDLDVFSPATASRRSEIRRQLGIPQDAIAVLLAGQTVEGIGLGIASHHAIAALNSLPKGMVVPVVVGHSASRVAAQMTGPSIALPFQAAPADMAACYQAADLCLVTSEVETFGRIGAESQACGTPVVAFGTGGIPEVVADGVGGRVVPTGDAVALAARLAELALDRALLARMGSDGRRYVADRFDQAGIASRHVELYRQALAGREATDAVLDRGR